MTALSLQQRAGEELRSVLELATPLCPGKYLVDCRHFVYDKAYCIRRTLLPAKKTSLLIVSAELDDKIMFAGHDDPLSGPQGCTRTLARVRKLYYRPKVATRVKRYVQACRQR